VVLPIAMVALFFSLISIDISAFLFYIASLSAHYFCSLVEFMAKHLRWSFVEETLRGVDLLILYGLAFTAIVRPKRWLRWAIAVLVGVAIIWRVIMSHPFDMSEKDLAVTFLDVGQGAAVAIRLPGGRVTLIDGGGIKGDSLDLGRSVLEPFLKKVGVEIVDRIIITHPHPDHFKGLGYIIDNFGAKSCMVGNYPEDELDASSSEEWGLFLHRLRESKVQVEPLVPGEWEDAGVTFRVFSPPEVIPEGWTVNDASAVIRVSYEDVSFLITGDIESAAESYIVESDLGVGSTVLQVPHHGSSTSSSSLFLDEVTPQYGVIQVGASNSYGFPEGDVLSRFEERSIKIYRTDQNGAVTFITNGEKMKIFSAARCCY